MRSAEIIKADEVIIIKVFEDGKLTEAIEVDDVRDINDVLGQG